MKISSTKCPKDVDFEGKKVVVQPSMEQKAYFLSI